MNLKNKAIPALALAISLSPCCSGVAAAQTARTFSHPDRIRYDRQCLTIDGKDIFIYSGAFHFFRCPKELWPDRFQKIKDAGFNCVETYVAWNWCERQLPASTNDFSKVNLKDLDDWLTMAEHYGLYVIVRPGPYICAEWATGGYPEWLLTKKPEAQTSSDGWLRSDDPVYLAWCKHWYDAVCPVIARHQITRKAPGQPGVILVQVENEYDYAHFPDEVKIGQVKALAEDARAAGIDVPLITCWTHQVRGSTDPMLRQIFDCDNFYPRWNVEGELRGAITKLRAEQPDAPLATTELQGGWFSQVGGKLSEDQDGVTAAQIQNITLFAMQMGETIMNYYMLFGGSNPGDWAARDITTTYDYDAPIREWGGVDARYERVWAIGHMLREHGAELARAVAADCVVSTSQKDVTVAERRAPDGSRFLFVRTGEHTETREGTATVKEKSGEEITFDYRLEPFGSKILYLPSGVTNAAQGEWLPKPAPAIERPTDLPAGVAITSAKMKADPGPSHWMKLKPEETLPQAGIYDSHFIFYRTKISCAAPTNLMVAYPDGDAVLATINGKPARNLGNQGGNSVFQLPAGVNRIELLYENRGFANGGRDMERPGGIVHAELTGNSPAKQGAIAGWRMHLVNSTGRRPEVAPDFDDADWTPVAASDEEANQLTANQTAVFRAPVQVAASDLNGRKMIVNFGRIDDDGWIYVNGKMIGKTTDWSRPYSFDVTERLHPGRNIIAVVVRNDGGAGGLGLPALETASEGAAISLAAVGRPKGDEHQWWSPKLRDSTWKTANLGGADAVSPDQSRLTWYRMKFSLPAPQPGVWVPWRLHLIANGNGFLYLNGHAMGRYWEAGPQHDFFLPECWLNFGGKPNNITLNLRPLNQGAEIRSATVEPYSDFAEKR
ncbi:MAG TPA: beta-galactosidase [Verrucomicrobiae bacterium]|nr:beta-galactosidase [Verrucomicrobiae bacterium]